MNTPRYIDHPPCHVVPDVNKEEVQLQIGAFGSDYRVLFLDEENARRLAAQLVKAADEIAGTGAPGDPSDLAGLTDIMRGED